MNTQEREQLTTFLQQLAQAHAGAKDAEAQAMIAATFARQPDAPYLVVQRALLLDAAIQNADAQIAQLKAQVAQLTQQQRAAAPAGGSFLDATSWGRNPAPVPLAPTMGNASFQAAAQPPSMPQAAPAPYAPAGRGFQAPSFLSGMASTAAGVAAGAFLFQGINHLVGQHAGAAPEAHSLSSATPDTASPLLDAPADSSALADGSSAGFSELLDIGPGDTAGFDDGGDAGDWA